MSRQSGWIRVTKSEICPICDADHWCRVSADGKVVQCMWVESQRPFPGESGGWIHPHPDVDATHIHPRPPRPQPKRLTDHEYQAKWEPWARHCYRNREAQVRRLAKGLGVAYWALDELYVGYRENYWTFPEKNHRRQIVGINRRYRDGKKMQMSGSKRALTYCDAWLAYPGPVFVVEGGSDVAAGLTLGLCIVGRPSNIGGVEYLVKLLGPVTGRRIVVFGERDWNRHEDLKPAAQKRHDPKCRLCNQCYPGKYGALHVHAKLKKRFIGRKVEWRMPPDGAKDLRVWLNAQALDVEDQAAAFAVGKVFGGQNDA